MCKVHLGFWNVARPRPPIQPGLVLVVRLGVAPGRPSTGSLPALLWVGCRGQARGLHSATLQLTMMDVVRAGSRMRQARVAGRVSSASCCPALWLQTQTSGFSTCQMSAQAQRGPLRLFITALGQKGQGLVLLTERQD